MVKKYIYLIFFISLVNLLHAKELVNVGIYQNAPKIFVNENGVASGFFVDILNYISQKEGWQLNYVECEWSTCLEKVQNAEIDIMPDVAYTDLRREKFLFSKESVFSSWSVLYRYKNVKIDSIFDVEGKKIAILKDSSQASAVKELLLKFNINNITYVEVQDYKNAFELLNQGKIDSVIVNRFYELKNTIGDNAVKTSIIIKPSTIRFTFSPLRTDLQKKIDKNLKLLKDDKESVFYKSQKKWLVKEEPNKIPVWLIWIIIFGLIIIVLLIYLVVLFQRMVIKKSLELVEKEKLILLQSKQAAMGEMISLIAHQWRQPLSVINMSSNNILLSIELQEEIDNKAIKEYIKDVTYQTKHLSDTIDDFRNFYKTNKVKNKVLVSKILTKIEKILGNSFQSNNIEFIVENKNDFELYIYDNELLQVMLNILNNAKDILKINQPSKPKITLKVYSDNNLCNIEVCDNGGGIPKEFSSKIGEQYFTTKGKDGTGLGLYMSNIIVKEHLKGSLTWRNTNDGVCFSVSFVQSD